MIYLYQIGDRVYPHTDKNFAEQELKLGDPVASLTPEEWEEYRHRARIIDGSLILGPTEEEMEYEENVKAAKEAIRYLKATDYRVIKAAEKNVQLDDLYEGESVRRENARMIIRDIE